MNIKEAIEDLESILKNMELNHKTNVILYNDDKEAFEIIVKYFKDKSISNINIEKKIKDKIESNKQSLIGMKKSDLKRLITYENEVLKSLLEEDSMSIEEDIKILENLKKYLNLLIYEGKHKIYYNDLGWDEKTIDCINAIEHILAEREEDKKRIKELEVLEDDLKDKRIVYADTPEFEEKFIPKQKVKDILLKYKYVSISDTKGIVQFYQEFKKLVEDK